MMMSFYTSSHLILDHDTEIEADWSTSGNAHLLLTEHGDGIHRIAVSLMDPAAVDRLVDALNDARAMLLDPTHPARAAVRSDAA